MSQFTTYSQYVLVIFDKSTVFCYNIVSKKEITMERVVQYFKKTKGWNEERDSIDFINQINSIVV